MNQKIFLLFSICILVRTFFVIIVNKIDKKYLPYLGLLALLPAFGFLYFIFIGTRKKGALGQKIWWNNLRPIHAMLYLTFAYLAINRRKDSYKPLLIDVIIGLSGFLYYHFSKLFK